jgi:hypothetical protein
MVGKVKNIKCQNIMLAKQRFPIVHKEMQSLFQESIISFLNDFWECSIFNKIFSKTMFVSLKIRSLKMTKKKSRQDSLNTLKPIFDFWNSLFQIVLIIFLSDFKSELWWTKCIRRISKLFSDLIMSKKSCENL